MPEHSSTRGRPRVALVTCADLSDLDPDDDLLRTALTERGIDARPAVWDDPTIDWAALDLAVLRSTWDYAPRRDEFVAWAARVPRLANPADLVAWNTDKRYLEVLRAAGVPTVPTTWVRPGQRWQPPTRGEYVIKPAISAGSRDSGRYDLTDATHRRLAGNHLARLGAAGRLAMVQPYLDAVDTAGETALIYLAGPTGLAFSHAIGKGAMLVGPDQPTDGLFRPEVIVARTALPEQLAVAGRALTAVPGGTDRLRYARVDLIPGPDGGPVLVELELTEPSLFLGYAGGAAGRLAEAISTEVSARPR